MVTLRLTVLVGVASMACANVFTMEDAEVDPNLNASRDQRGTTEAPASAAPASQVDAVALSPCERYCASVMMNCTDDFAVYTSSETCQAVCHALPEGLEGDEVGNSVHCRMRAAEAAPSEPSYYCPIAGPGGAGVCGTNCESLCTIMESACSGENDQWDSTESCMTDCEGLADVGFYSTAPTHALYEGEHVQCRILHASSASLQDAAQHCPHASGAPPCVVGL